MRARLGDVEFSVVSEESPQLTNEITERTVERGTDIADHVRITPAMLSISGVVVGDDAGQKLNKLREYTRKGEILRYAGRNTFGQMIIQSFPTQHTVEIRNGFRFRMDLKQIRIARLETVQFVTTDPVRKTNTTSTQVQEVQEKGTQQLQEQQVDEQQKRSWLIGVLPTIERIQQKAKTNIIAEGGLIIGGVG